MDNDDREFGSLPSNGLMGLSHIVDTKILKKYDCNGNYVEDIMEMNWQFVRPAKYIQLTVNLMNRPKITNPKVMRIKRRKKDMEFARKLGIIKNGNCRY